MVALVKSSLLVMMECALLNKEETISLQLVLVVRDEVYTNFSLFHFNKV